MNQHNLADPFRMFCQEDFKSVKLLGDTLDVVKTVNTNNQLDALELLLECLDTLCDLGLLEPLLKLLGINTDRECTDGDNLALEFDCVGCCWQLAIESQQPCHNLDIISNLQDSRTTAEEVPSIIIGVESDQVTVQNTVENLVTDRQNSVDLATGEGSVEEETELDVALGVADLFAEHSG